MLNCENSGGVGAIIINNVAGMLYGTLGDTTTNATSIPAVGAAFEDRAGIVAANTADVSIGTSDYGFMSGTSMATPGVSGIAALVWSNHNDCTGTEIREALKATAEDQGAAGNDVYFGSGIVKAKAASDYLTANSCGGTTPPPVSDFTLSATGYKSKGKQVVDLSWAGATGNVDIFKDGSIIATAVGGAAYTDSLNVRSGGPYTYEVCETGTSTCTASVTVAF